MPRPILPFPRDCTFCGKPVAQRPDEANWNFKRRSTCGGECAQRTITVRAAEVNRRPLEERFWEKVEKMAPDGCWFWLASTRNGYGQIGQWSKGTIDYAHRVAYEMLVGPIPAGLVLDHICRNPSCVNPAHLEPVTQAENLRRGAGRPGVLR